MNSGSDIATSSHMVEFDRESRESSTGVLCLGLGLSSVAKVGLATTVARTLVGRQCAWTRVTTSPVNWDVGRRRRGLTRVRHDGGTGSLEEVEGSRHDDRFRKEMMRCKVRKSWDEVQVERIDMD